MPILPHDQLMYIWSIRVKGGKDLIVPNPLTPMSVIFGIKLCKVPPSDSYRAADLIKSMETRSDVDDDDDCCPDGHYRPSVTSSCVECPAGSHSATIVNIMSSTADD